MSPHTASPIGDDSDDRLPTFWDIDVEAVVRVVQTNNDPVASTREVHEAFIGTQMATVRNYLEKAWQRGWLERKKAGNGFVWWAPETPISASRREER